MRYLAASVLFLFNNEIISLLALLVITLLFGYDIMKERLTK